MALEEQEGKEDEEWKEEEEEEEDLVEVPTSQRRSPCPHLTPDSRWNKGRQTAVLTLSRWSAEGVLILPSGRPTKGNQTAHGPCLSLAESLRCRQCLGGTVTYRVSSLFPTRRKILCVYNRCSYSGDHKHWSFPVGA